jgi:phage gp46-like protein
MWSRLTRRWFGGEGAGMTATLNDEKKTQQVNESAEQHAARALDRLARQQGLALTSSHGLGVT